MKQNKHEYIYNISATLKEQQTDRRKDGQADRQKSWHAAISSHSMPFLVSSTPVNFQFESD